MMSSGRSLAPASTIMIASRVPETTRSSSDSLQVAVGRVDDELAVDPTHAHRADRAEERDLADRQRRRRRDRAEHVGVVLLVGREDRDDELDVVLVAIGEERADRAVGQTRRQDGRFRRPRLALDEAARDLARGVHPLLEVDREREEIEPGTGFRPVRGAEHHGVTEADGDGPARESGELAGLDGQRATTELRLEDLRQERPSSLPWRRRRPAGGSACCAAGAGCARALEEPRDVGAEPAT